MALEHRKYIVAHVETTEDRGLLGQVANAEPAALEHGEPGDLAALEQHIAPGGRDEPDDDRKDRRLAGPVLAEQPDRFATADGQRDLAHHRHLAEALGGPVRDQPAGLVDAPCCACLVHSGVKTPVTRPPPLEEKTEVCSARLTTSSGPLRRPESLVTVTLPERRRIWLRGSK